ncbi:sensor histidine kinase [Gracilibacillus halophilus]|uniref:sensor histidine kinase n=1 Tax=Gracilibacillus halophilus TaxID=470864 RepID=UPI001F099B75|nr:ATP-binding protein [Gracilibacillus halophilus]
MYENEADSLQARLSSIPITVIRDLEHFPSPENERNPNYILFKDYTLSLIDGDGDYNNLLEHKQLIVPKLSQDKLNQVMQDGPFPREDNYMITEDKTGEEQMVVFRPAFNNNQEEQFSLLQMSVSTATLHQVLWKQLFIFIGLSVLALITGLTLYTTVIQKTLNPLSSMIDRVKGIGANNLTERIPTYNEQEEIHKLSQSFNEMLERLENSFLQEKEAKEQMRQFVADASHELRTPITSVHGYLEVLLRGAAKDSEQLNIILNSMHGETKRVIKLVEELLLLAKLDRVPRLHLEETNMTDLIREMLPQLSFLAGDRDVEKDLTENLYTMADADKLKQVILNIFHNAVHYTDAETGIIKLSLVAESDFVKLIICDNGQGIEEKNLPYIFNRFYRADQSRTRHQGGAGLGLSISNSIIKAHNGEIAVESKVGDGTAFYIFIPLLK